MKASVKKKERYVDDVKEEKESKFADTKGEIHCQVDKKGGIQVH